MEKGKVKWFNSSENKLFGFITTESGGEIFFHFNDGRPVIPDNNKRETKFSDEPTIKTAGKTFSLRMPKVGDEVVFERRWAEKGDKASPWGYQSHFDRAMKIISALPEPVRCRIFKSMGSIGEAGTPEDHKDAEVIWEGTDINDVMKQFPLPQSNRSPGSDPLLPYYSHDDGFEIRHWWEKQNPDGTWEQCPDQRPLSGVNRQFERITNRW